MSDLFPVQHLQATCASSNMIRFDVTLSEAHLQSFRKSGQYVMASFRGGKPKPLAIANAPLSSSFVFLLKEEDEKTRRELLDLSSTELEMSYASGPGFPMEKLENRPLLLAGVGSGIAPLLSTLLYLEREGKKNNDNGDDKTTPLQRTTLLYGLQHDDALVEKDVLLRLEQQGLSVVLAYSKETPKKAAVGVALRGYVQDHVQKLTLSSNMITFLCGLRPMEEALIASLELASFDASQVFRNY